MSKFHSLRVAAINKESQDTNSITLEVPVALQDTFAFQAGQYNLTIKLDHKGEEIRRSYSMSSAPKKEHLTITVKTVAGGKATIFLIKNSK